LPKYVSRTLLVLVATAAELGAGDDNPNPGTGGTHGPTNTGTDTVDVPSDMETVVDPAATGVTITLAWVPEPDTATSAIVASAIVTARVPRAFDTASVVGAVPVLYETEFGTTASGAGVAVGVAIDVEFAPHAANTLAKQKAVTFRWIDIVYSRGHVRS
jgi:hypothetical protein